MPAPSFPVDDDLKFDKRLSSFFLRKQVIRENDLKKHLDSLPDSGPASEACSVQQGRELAPREAIRTQEAIVPALTFASMDDSTDDDNPGDE